MKEIILTQGKTTIIDDEDYDAVINLKWHAAKLGHTFYAARNVRIEKTTNGQRQRVQFLHRLITKCEIGKKIDHINGNGLDNRRCNLRIVTTRENGQNRHHNKTTMPVGVRYLGTKYKTNPYRAMININGKMKHIGVFPTPEIAHEEYLNACKGL